MWIIYSKSLRQTFKERTLGISVTNDDGGDGWNRKNLPVSALYKVLQFAHAQKIFVHSLGGFPIEIKTRIRYHVICCYHNFTLWNYDNNKLYDILF